MKEEKRIAHTDFAVRIAISAVQIAIFRKGSYSYCTFSVQSYTAISVQIALTNNVPIIPIPGGVTRIEISNPHTVAGPLGLPDNCRLILSICEERSGTCSSHDFSGGQVGGVWNEVLGGDHPCQEVSEVTSARGDYR